MANKGVTNQAAIWQLRDKIKRVLAEKNATQAEFARFLNVHKQSVNNFIVHNRAYCKIEVYTRLYDGIESFKKVRNND